MATHTTHYNLIKPALNDKVNITNLNDNADVIDAALYNKVNTDDTQNITTSANKCMMTDGTTNVEDALDDVKSGLTNLHYHKFAESASTGTYADKLQSLATAYNSLSLEQRRSALLVVNDVDIYHLVNCSGNWYSVWVDSTAAYLSRYGVDGSAYVESNGTVTDNSSVENGNVFSVWVCE